MDQQAKFSNNKDTVDVADSSIAASDYSVINAFNQVDDGTISWSPIMSNEELKIREELEDDIERDLEQEIKDGIYQYALRLHRLYQTQKEKKKKKKKQVSEIIISIRLEGGTKIEINEIKRDDFNKDKKFRDVYKSHRSGTSEKIGTIRDVYKGKKFDWAQSLRSSSSDLGSIRSTKKLIHEDKNTKQRIFYT